MTTPLKNISTTDLEHTIAQALQHLASAETQLVATISALQYIETGNQVNIQLNLHERFIDPDIAPNI